MGDKKARLDTIAGKDEIAPIAVDDATLANTLAPDQIAVIGETLDFDTLGQTFGDFVDDAPGDISRDSFLAYLVQGEHIDRKAFVAAHHADELSVADALSDSEERYIELGHVGEGGMGEILIARDTELKRKVAIKRLKRVTDRTTKRFLREAWVTAQLDHPNIVPVHSLEHDLEAGELSFAMKLIHGRTLTELVDAARACYTRREKPPESLRLRTRLEHFLKVCDAMAYAHARGVLHRDLKPDNIMVGEFGEVYVMDWGIAYVMKEETQEEAVEVLEDEEEMERDLFHGLTREGAVIGTPSYMSPEQALGRLGELDARSETYTLGLILFELVTLNRAIHAESLQTLLERAMGAELQPLEHAAGLPIPPDLVAIIHRATARAAKDRYPHAEALGDDIRRFLSDKEVSARPDTRLRAFLRWTSAHRQLAFGLTMMLIALFSAIALVSVARQQAATEREKQSVIEKQQATEREKLAIQNAQRRESRLAEVQTAIANQSHAIDTLFVRLEGLVESLTHAAVTRLAQAPSTRPGLTALALFTPNVELYSHLDYTDPERAPSDFEEVAHYHKAISLEHPVYKLAPQVSLEQVRPRLRQLAPLREQFHQMMLESLKPAFTSTWTEARAAIYAGGSPVRWSYVGLEEGIMFSYPGKGPYPEAYDPRVRPWYALGRDASSPTWGNPYVDLQGQGLILPCVQALRAPNGRFLGVAGLEVAFDDLILSLMQPTHPASQERFLLDQEGRIVVRSSHLATHREEGRLHDALELPPYPIERIRDDVRAQRSGITEITLARQSKLIAYYRIDALGWYYVEELDTARVLEDTRP